jgi:FlaG/FlaF family flagellin (archaellin)
MSSNHQRRRSWPRRLRESHKGVSEIIGTILTVSITVILFAGIMLYVGTMPQPKGTTSTSFAGQTTYNDVSGTTFINITQMGGQQLDKSDTMVIITVDGSQLGPFTLAQGQLYQNWAPGLTWAYSQPGIAQTANVQALIYQKSVGDVIWQGSVSDSDAARMPVISNKGMWDGNYVYNSPIFNNQTVHFFVLFASTQDIEYLDTSSVTMDGSSIGLSSSIHLVKDPSNQFMYYTSTTYTSQYVWTGHRVSFTFTTTDARDGPVVYSVLNVLANPSGETGGGNNVNPTPNMWVNAMNGYAIFEYTDWLINSYGATPRTSFNYGDKVVFVVASQALKNVLIDRSLYMYDRMTGLMIPVASSPNYNFAFHEYTGGYYVFNATFNTASLPRDNELYPVRMSLMDNSQPTNSAIIPTNITVGTPTTNLATLRTYASSADRNSNILTNTFNVTDKIYVRISYPSGAGTWLPSFGSLYVAGYNGVKQINLQVGGVGTNPANYVVFYERTNVNSIDIRIDLNNASQDVWPLGYNKYTIAYNPFQTTVTQFFVGWTIGISSPMYDYDLAVASGPLTASANSLVSILEFYKGEYRWMRGEALIPQFEQEKPGGGSYRPPDALLTRVGDIDGDSMNEVAVLVSGEGGIDIEVYDYFQGAWWARIAVLVPGTVVDFQLANLDFDTDLDIVYAIGSTVYRVVNQGTYWQKMTEINTGLTIKGMLVANFTSTIGAKTACDIMVFEASTSMKTYRYCYRDGAAPPTGPTVYSQTVATIGSKGDMIEAAIKTSDTARAKIFVLDSNGGINKNGYWNGAGFTFNGSAFASGITGGTQLLTGNFVGMQYVDLVIVSKLYVYFVVQTSENTFVMGTGSILTQGGVGNDNGFTAAAVADVNRDGYDDLVMSDNLETGNTATGQGLLRIALNKAGTNGWWVASNGNVIIFSTIFGIINDVSVAKLPSLTPY